MDDKYGPFLFDDELSAEQRAALEEHFAEDSAFADGWRRWQRVRQEIRNRFDERLPNRDLLVLFALEQDGQRDLLSNHEKEALDRAREQIRQAIDAIPALEKIVGRIQRERADFDEVWEDHLPSEESMRIHREEAGAVRKERRPRQPAHARDHRSSGRWAWRLTLAALFLGAAVLAVFYGPGDAGQRTVTVADGEQQTVQFADGTTARLVGAAALTYDSGVGATEEQQVMLRQGRAYFDVVNRRDGAFVVQTPTATATVLGTKFGVYTSPESTDVVLVEGSVQVGGRAEAATESVMLEPGQGSTVRRDEGPSSPRHVDLASALEWTGMFVFRSEAVEVIAERLSEHYQVSVTVGAALVGEPVTATFEREQPVDEIVRALAQTLGARVQSTENGYRIVGSR